MNLLGNKMPKETRLRVQEALQEEAYKGIVRIDSQTMKSIDVKPGDIVEIEGSRITVGLVDRAYPSDIGQGIIRMDGILRRNAKTGIGENVIVRKADVKEAKTVTIAPAQEGIMIQVDPDVFRRGLLGRALLKGDIISLGGAPRRRKTLTGSPFEDIFEAFEAGFMGMGNFGLGSLKFIVADTNPKQVVIITENTEVKVSPKAIEVSEDKKIPEITYEDIGGLEEEIKKVREMVELPLKHPEIFERLSVDAPKGVLLHGVPGTGKTLLAKAVANESEANFLLVNGPELTSKFYGESEKRIRDLFDEAEKNAPSIIFIDEIDAIAPKREETYGEVERRMVAQLLATMDGLKSRGRVVVIGATNRPNALDPALRRPGRFDREITIGVPNRAGRLNILKIHTRNMPIRGSIYSDILEKNFSPGLERKIKDINNNINKNKEDLINLEDEITKLNKERKNADKNLLNKILITIQRLDQKRTQLINELQKIKDSLSFSEELINKLKTNKIEIKLIVEDIKIMEEAKERYSEEDPRLQVIKNSLGDPYKKLESFNLLNEIIEKTRQEGIPRDLDRLSEITHGFVGADLSALCKEAAMNVLRRILPEMKLREKEPIPQTILEKLLVTNDDFKEALKIVRPSAMREVLIEKPNVKWEDIGGLEDLKQELKEAIEWPLKHPDAFTRVGIRAPRGILIYGPPGTGKTLLAKAIATESEANFILVQGPELVSKWVGESEKGIRKIFEKARQASPAIVFFDEIDSIAARRGTEVGTKVIENMVNTLLSEMDGLKELNDVVVLAATNRPDLIDPGLLRPGRFDRIISTTIPNKAARLVILNIHTKNMPLAKDVDLEKLAGFTEHFAGSDIEALCREAAMLALRKNLNIKNIAMEHFEEALKKVKPSITDHDLKKYKEIEEQYLRTARGAAIREQQSYLG
jgi:transitional endoplasmic reticulum ATPase